MLIDNINFNKFNIILVGVGGTGSHLISFLGQLIGNNSIYRSSCSITLADGDRVEKKNLRTQKFLESDVGKLKAEVLAERYSNVFDLDIGYVDEFIETPEDIDRLIKNDYGSTLNIIISCVDNNKARKIMDIYFNSNSISNLVVVDTGNSSGDGDLTGQTIVSYKEKTKIILPSVSTYFPQILIDEIEKTEGCGEVLLNNIQNIGANITSASTTFNILNNIIAFKKITGDVHAFNATSNEISNMKINMRSAS